MPEQLRFFFLRPKPNHAVDFDPDGTDACRGSTTSSTGSPPPRPAGRSGARSRRASRPRSATRCSTRMPTSLRRPRCSGPPSRHLALLAPDPERRRAARGSRPRRGVRSTSPRAEILDERDPRGRGAGSRCMPPSAPASRSAVTPCPRRPRPSTTASGAYLAAPGRCRRRPAAASRAMTWQDAIFSDRTERGVEPRVAFTALYLAFLGRTNGPRAGWLLASLDRELRRRAGCARPPAATDGGRSMSVGLQRLRDDADAIRKGADRQGRGPGAHRSRPGARRPPANAARRGRHAEGRAQRRVEADRRGDQGRRVPERPGGRRPQGRIDRAGERIAAVDAELAKVEAEVDDLLLRIPNPADPDVPIGGEEANVTVRTWGELLPAEQPRRRRGRRRRTRPAAPRGPQAPLGARRGARHHRQRPRREDRRLRGSPSTRARAPRSSARSSTGSSTSTSARTA